MTLTEPLLFLDSGAGGLPYLDMARRRLPAEDFVYLADRANYPYGQKSAAELRRLVVGTVGRAIRLFGPKLVVVACNTASVVALAALRRAFDLPFVGVVPAVKPAGARCGGGGIVVVATHGTVSGAYLKKLIQDFAGGLEVRTIPASRLVDFAEYGAAGRDPAETAAVVRRELAPHLDGGLSCVVLGCTHFTLLEGAFRAVLGPQVELIDSREGVTRRIAALLEERGLRRPGPGAGRALLYVQGSAEEARRYRAFAAAFGLEPGGRMEDA
jgi:glutamate racemase